MACASFVTKGVAVGATGAQILPYNILRKGLFLAVGTSADDIQIAFGESPAALDYFSLPAGHPLQLEGLAPISKVWAKGTGTLITGEAL